MITLELTERQAKLLLILTGACAGELASDGVYAKLIHALNVDEYSCEIPEPNARIYSGVGLESAKLYSVTVTQSHIDALS
jgi:hypothetical protein